ncbi:hypothetical protein BD410DRAFT_807221 [Rickenella mellea]|uniref:Uncharacterized protein n=1 Tax=Rickenella mellea TaxID=50990 RepID=A0A4Y7PRY2_9AGAM|nr:hypothetical protein BD410DRAFT_807221 [Rickenella mellea]
MDGDSENLERRDGKRMEVGLFEEGDGDSEFKRGTEAVPAPAKMPTPQKHQVSMWLVSKLIDGRTRRRSNDGVAFPTGTIQDHERRRLGYPRRRSQRKRRRREMSSGRVAAFCVKLVFLLLAAVIEWWDRYTLFDTDAPVERIIVELAWKTLPLQLRKSQLRT